MLAIFSSLTGLVVGILFLVAFSLTVQMAEGATFSVVPFINKKAIGAVSGVVGAGGNAGAFFAALLLKSMSAGAEKSAIALNQGLGEEAVKAAQAAAASAAVSSGYLLIGGAVVICGLAALAIKFSAEDEKVAELELAETAEPALVPVRS